MLRSAAVSVLFGAFAMMAAPQQPTLPKPISIIELVSGATRYDGQRILVIGYLVVTKEETLLYLHHEDFENGLSSNAILVDARENIWSQRNSLNKKYVALVGKVQLKNSTLSSFPTLRLTEISNATLWSDPEHPRATRFGDIHSKDPY